MTRLSALEMAVAVALARQLGSDGDDTLIAQLKTASVRRRDFTGVGFYTEFDVDRGLPRAAVATSPAGWVRSQVGPDGYPLEFMLYVSDGYAETIEAYSFLDGYGDLDLLTAAFTPPEEITPQTPDGGRAT